MCRVPRDIAPGTGTATGQGSSCFRNMSFRYPERVTPCRLCSRRSRGAQGLPEVAGVTSEGAAGVPEGSL